MKSTLKTFNEIFQRSCQWRGDDALFVDEREQMSGHESFEAATRMAACFRALGAGPGDGVAFLSTCSVRHAIGWFGALLGGQVTCNLHLRETPQRLGEALRWLDTRVLVHDESQAELARAAVAAAGIHCIRVSLGESGDAAASWTDALAGTPGPVDVPHRVQPKDLAAIILSSGSTGRPKGVMHTQASLLEACKGGQYALCVPSRGDTGLLYMQPSFAGWSIIALPLVAAGCKVVFGERFTPASFLDTVEREQISIAPLVPTMWRMVFGEDLEARDLQSLRLVTIAGEPPAASDIAQLYERVCPRIASLYLSAEGHMGSGVIAFTEELRRPGKAACTGRAAPHVGIRIIDPSGSFNDVVAPGVEGEIAIAGPSIALGYWQDPELTAARFQGGWWRSGDLGRIDADGDLWVTGRIDNVINTGGIKVSGEEIERALLAHTGVAQCAVAGVPDERFGRRIEAWIVARDPRLDGEQLGEFCRDVAELSSVKVPKAFHFVPVLPTGPTGKLLRRALRGDAT
jgi:acyl-CoA synthetase (AMP-forming)/AMP-acid ligase II